MNRSEPSGPDGPLPLLAGYADRELDEATQRMVGEWVERDPAAAEMLHDQEQLAPTNTEFWAATEPPLPSEAAWSAVRDAVAARLPLAAHPRPVRRRRRPFVVSAAGLALAVLVGWGLIVGPRESARGHRPPLRPAAATPDPLADFAELPLAGPSDVMVEAVDGNLPPVALAADHPLPETLPLPDVEDVTLLEIDPAPNGVVPLLTDQPGDRPMIYAVGPRAR